MFYRLPKIKKWVLVGSIILMFGAAISIYYQVTNAFLYTLLIESIFFFSAMAYQNKQILASHNKMQLALHTEQIKKEEALKNNEQKKVFLENLLHELGTPLSLVFISVGELRIRIKARSDRQYLDDIRYNVERIKQMFNDLLFIAKNNVISQEIKEELSSIDANIEDIVKQFKFYAKQKNIDLESQVEKNMKGVYDQNILKKICRNILMNALKYTPYGGRVVCNAYSQKEYVVIKIEDNGEGIQNIDKIFDRFYIEKQKMVEGFGLGLSMVKDLLDFCGGTIDVQSKKEQGSIFTIYFPIKNLQKERPSDLPPKSDKVSDIDSLLVDQKYQILLVEDNIALLYHIEKVLEREFDVFIATNGEEAYQIAKDKVPNIIISDVIMPHIGGLELCQKVKTDEVLSHIPIILLTSQSDLSSQLQGYKSGADVYIPKPFEIEVLKAQIYNQIEQRKKIFEAFSIPHNYSFELSSLCNELDIIFWKRFKTQLYNSVHQGEASVQDIADRLLISRIQLYRKILALTNQSVGVFIIKAKMDIAKESLLKDHQNISEVAYKVGYSSIASFSKAFKKEYGQSPKSYVKNNL